MSHQTFFSDISEVLQDTYAYRILMKFFENPPSDKEITRLIKREFIDRRKWLLARFGTVGGFSNHNYYMCVDVSKPEQIKSVMCSFDKAKKEELFCHTSENCKVWESVFLYEFNSFIKAEKALMSTLEVDRAKFH